MPTEQTHTPPDNAIRAFLSARFAGQTGWLCLGWIAGDPRVESLRETWFALPRQFTAAVQCAQTLADCGHNLYVAPCLFRERARRYATALPCAWLWLDDVAIAGAELVESSPDNFQSWLPLDQPLDAAERSALQRALRDASAGADACSADAVHLARLPGGWNRKQHPAWRVRLAQPAGAPVGVADLWAQFPSAQPSTPAAGSAGDWRTLPDGAPLAASPRFQALVQANAQLGQLLADAPIGLDCHGYRDDSRSARRAIFVCQLLRARYPDDEIRALAAHFADLLDSGRGDAIFHRDVDRLLAKYTPAGHTAAATRALGRSPGAALARGGRPITITAQALLDVYHQYADSGPRGIVLEWTRGEVARHLRVSTDTIQRREGELIAAGTIRREISADRQRSFVILSPATWDVAAQGGATGYAATILPEAGPSGPGLMAAPEAAMAAERPGAPALPPRAGAEETHHPAAGSETVGEPSSADSPPATGAAPRTPGGATAGAGVSVPAPPARMIVDRMHRPPQQHITSAATHAAAMPSRAPPRCARQR